MSEQFVKEIVASGSAALSQFAQAAGQTAEHLYSVLVRQQVIDGIAGLFQWGLFGIIELFALKKAMSIIEARKKEDSYNDNFDVVCGLLAFSVVVFIVLLGIGTNLEQILNPEYYAIEFIFDGVKGGK